MNKSLSKFIFAGNVLHLGQYGGAEVAPALGRLREAPNGRRGLAAEAQPRRGRYQRPRREGQAGQLCQSTYIYQTVFTIKF